MIDSARSSTDSRLGSVLALTFVLVAAVAMLLRVPSVAQPLGIDQSLWASAVRGIDRGQLLYRDVWEQRPPGIYWAYLGAFRLLGWEGSTVAWIDIVAAALTATLIYLIARRLADVVTAALAAAVYATMTMPAWLYGDGGFLERAVSETFIALCIGACAWFAVRWVQHPSAALASLFGLCAGASLVFKPNAGLYFPALVLWAWLHVPTGTTAKQSATSLANACLVALVIPAAALLWLWRLDLLRDATTAVVDFNRYYVGEGFSPGAYAITFSKAVWLRMKTEPLWTAGGAGAAAATWTLLRERRLAPLPGLAVIWGAACVCVIVVNGARLFNSYFIQAVPPLSLLGAWFLVSAFRGTVVSRALGAALVVVMAVLLVWRDYPGRVYRNLRADIDVLSGRTDRALYLERFGGYANGRGYSARANEELAEYIRAHTSPQERIFLFGINGAGVYFDADRLTAHRFLRVNFFVETEFPDPAFRLDAVLRDLESSKPAYIVFERLHRSSVPAMQQAVDGLPEHPHVQHLLRNYRLETTIEDFTLYRRVD